MICIKSGSILSSIFWLKLSSSVYLYSFLNLSMVWNKDLRGVVPESLISLPSLRLVWKVYKLYRSRNKMSGILSFKVLAPLKQSESRSILSQWVEAWLTALNTLQSSSYNCEILCCKQRLHRQQFCRLKKLWGSIVC